MGGLKYILIYILYITRTDSRDRDRDMGRGLREEDMPFLL